MTSPAALKVTPFKLQTLRGLSVRGPLTDARATDLAVTHNLQLLTLSRDRRHTFTGHGTRLNALARALTSTETR